MMSSYYILSGFHILLVFLKESLRIKIGDLFLLWTRFIALFLVYSHNYSSYFLNSSFQYTINYLPSCPIFSPTPKSKIPIISPTI